MRDSELKALISLLEDEDPEVKGHVHGRLISLGHEVIPTLESVWEGEENLVVQAAIEEIIYLIQSENAIERLRAWMREDHPQLLDGWAIFTSFQYPELEIDQFKSHIARLVNRTWLELRSGMSMTEKIMMLNRMLFIRERFRANRKNLSDPQNFFLNGLIETKKGAPISLGILYLILCKELEIPVHGIILPGYFVLLHRNEKEEIFIDVFNKGSLFVREELTRFLKEMNVAEEEKYYQPSSNQHIIIELIRALMLSFRQRRQPEKVAEMEKLIDRLMEEE
ncbi:MAG: transglutaminase-like domain-containing protein [Bacteroidia bacterium]|nr:transglutaminase-like domain-containing protein [Bacteroidia bacterium]